MGLFQAPDYAYSYKWQPSQYCSKFLLLSRQKLVGRGRKAGINGPPLTTYTIAHDIYFAQICEFKTRE
jgi:hypothetical protein